MVSASLFAQTDKVVAKATALEIKFLNTLDSELIVVRSGALEHGFHVHHQVDEETNRRLVLCSLSHQTALAAPQITQELEYATEADAQVVGPF